MQSRERKLCGTYAGQRAPGKRFPRELGERTIERPLQFILTLDALFHPSALKAKHPALGRPYLGVIAAEPRRGPRFRTGLHDTRNHGVLFRHMAEALSRKKRHEKFPDVLFKGDVL